VQTNELLNEAIKPNLAGNTVTFTLPQPMLDELNLLCETKGLNRSALLRGLLKRLLVQLKG
jgi:metal-responsive CopG/Arc/MetJ family transcriptional regulator